MTEKQPPIEEKAPTQSAQQAPQAEGRAEQHEKEFSPEVIEKIMEKVRDINEDGTAFSVINSRYPTPQLESGESKLESVFAHGLIGTAKDQPGVDRDNFNNRTHKDAYIEVIKRRGEPEVFFSIVGRTDPQSIRKIEYYESYFKPPKNTIAIIFELSHFKEVGVPDGAPLKSHTFSPYAGGGDPKYNSKDFDQRILTYIEYGFRLMPRVPPRYFRGVIFYLSRKDGSADYEEILPERFAERARQIASEMINVNKNTELFLPIYDVHGNLWWPKEMSHEEVKKFVAERKEKKREKGN